MIDTGAKMIVASNGDRVRNIDAIFVTENFSFISNLLRYWTASYACDWRICPTPG
jgi:hypothetical protein